ncbi:hypothetical protein Btru_066700 [Bulinus truncatus]|nr:hypothetical protein Btru_066700 [Bulinus truncatus]
MDSDYFFYEQSRHRPFQKRFRKLPEDLPDSLKANLNPKVAAYFANKEKQRQDEDIFGDGKKTLMPEISQVFNALKNHLDSSLCNDEDSQRYIFEEAKNNAGHILFQLSRIIYYYDNIASLIPKSLECQMMVGYCELTADIQIIPRDWQTQASKEAYFKKISDTLNGEDPDKASPSIMEEGRSTRSHSIVSESGKGNKKRLFTKSGTGLPEIYEDGETMSIYGNQNVKRSDSRLSGMSKRSSRPRLSDFRASSIANPSNLMSVLQFQLSSKLCQEKGLIYLESRTKINRFYIMPSGSTLCLQVLHQVYRYYIKSTVPTSSLQVLHQVCRHYIKSTCTTSSLQFLHQVYRYYIKSTGTTSSLQVLHQVYRYYIKSTGTTSSLQFLHQVFRWYYIKSADTISSLQVLHQVYRYYIKYTGTTSSLQFLHQVYSSYIKSTGTTSSLQTLHQVYMYYIKSTGSTSSLQFLHQLYRYYIKSTSTTSCLQVLRQDYSYYLCL